MLLESCETYITWMLATLYTSKLIANCIDSGIQATVKPNKHFFVEINISLTVCKRGFHNGAIVQMLQFG